MCFTCMDVTKRKIIILRLCTELNIGFGGLALREKGFSSGCKASANWRHNFLLSL